jgi:hypothetical protein
MSTARAVVVLVLKPTMNLALAYFGVFGKINFNGEFFLMLAILCSC